MAEHYCAMCGRRLRTSSGDFCTRCRKRILRRRRAKRRVRRRWRVVPPWLRGLFVVAVLAETLVIIDWRF